MTKRMLDTNAVRAEQRCCISVIVAAEIHYGLEKKELNARKRQLIEAGLARLEVLPWTEACALVTADQAFANVAELQLEAW